MEVILTINTDWNKLTGVNQRGRITEEIFFLLLSKHETKNLWEKLVSGGVQIIIITVLLRQKRVAVLNIS